MSKRGPRCGSSLATAKSWRQAAVHATPTVIQMIHAGKNEPWMLTMGSQPAADTGARATIVNRSHPRRFANILTVTMSEHSSGRMRAASVGDDTLYCARSESGHHSHVGRARHAGAAARGPGRRSEDARSHCRV